MSRRKDARKMRRVPDAELIEAASQALDVLDLGIQQFDGGGQLGVKLASSQMRLLVGTGRGNDLLRRIAERGKVAAPMVTVTSDAVADRGIEFSIGALPILPTVRQGGRPSKSDLANMPPHVQKAFRRVGLQKTVTLPRLMESRVLFVESGAEREEFTWNTLIADVANKTGPVHADDEVVEVLDALANYRVAEFHPLGFAFRSLGVAVSQVGTDLLTGLGTIRERPEHLGTVNSLWIGGAFAARLPKRTPEGHNHTIGLECVITSDRPLGMFRGPGWELRIQPGGPR